MSEIPRPHDQDQDFPAQKTPFESLESLKQSLIEQNPSREQRIYIELIFQVLPITMAATRIMHHGFDLQQSYPFTIDDQEPVIEQQVPPQTLVRLTDDSRGALLAPFNLMNAYLVQELQKANIFLETFRRNMLKGQAGNKLERLIYETMYKIMNIFITDDEYKVFIEPDLTRLLQKRPQELHAENQRKILGLASNSIITFLQKMDEPMTLDEMRLISIQCLYAIEPVIPLNPTIFTIVNKYISIN